MNKIQKYHNSECYILLSEPFRIYQKFSVSAFSENVFWSQLKANMNNLLFSCLPPASTLVPCLAYFFDSEDRGGIFLQDVS
jgi:hypothetical protein